MAVPFVVVIEVAASVARFYPSSDGIKPWSIKLFTKFGSRCLRSRPSRPFTLSTLLCSFYRRRKWLPCSSLLVFSLIKLDFYSSMMYWSMTRLCSLISSSIR